MSSRPEGNLAHSIQSIEYIQLWMSIVNKCMVAENGAKSEGLKRKNKGKSKLLKL